MRYAKYPDTVYADPATPLVDAYVDYIRAYERRIMPPDQERQRQIRELPVGDTRRSALLIGRACLLGKKGNEVEKRLSQRAHSELTPSSQVIGDRIRAAQQRNIARLIEGRDNPTRIAEARANTHDLAIHALKSTYDGTIPVQRNSNNKGETLGTRGEARVLAAFTRLKHPWFLVVPALEHHDRHEINNRDAQNSQFNFDILGVESYPADVDNSGPNVFKAQVKSHCFGLCSIPNPSPSISRNRLRAQVDTKVRNRRQFEYERTLYNPDISLISACCDFKPHETDTLSSIDRLLLKEYTGKATPADIDTLDAVSSNLLLTVTGDPMRRGTYHVEPIDLVPAFEHVGA